MKKLALSIVLAALSSTALFAQDLTGTWQGTLEAGGRSLRGVFRISRGGGTDLQGVFYSIDQTPQPIPLGAITLQGALVKWTIPAVGGTYEGRLSADGNSIVGTFSQGPTPIPLTLARATPATAWAIPDAPAPPKPMAADASPSFDVATIKPSQPGTQGKLLGPRGRTFGTLNTSLRDLITFAYGVHARQIDGAPSWVETDNYDITAQPGGEGQPNLQQWMTMLQKLLADRFKLTFHREKKELSAYALVVGRTGAKLTKSAGDPNGLPSLLFRGLGLLPAQNATMKDFAEVMQGAVLDRPVVDQTGLEGRYDFMLRWTPDETQFAQLGARVQPPTDDPAAPPNLFSAIQEQLGLRLEGTRAPVEVLVIDTVDHPTPN